MQGTTLVAGGAGFIGSHLCAALLRSGSRVICLDNFLTGRRTNLSGFYRSAEFEVVEHDLIESLPSIPKVDTIFHLASPASPPGYERHPIETLRVNSEGTRHLLELASRCDARLVLASTSEVYGDPIEHPQREDYRGNVSSIGPRSMYDEGKRFAEAMTMSYARTRGVDARIARIFNTYGPHSDPLDGRLVPNFIVQALRGEPLTVYGNGQQTRSLCYVDDLVDGLLRVASCADARNEVIDVGNPDEHTILEFAELTREVVGSASPIVFADEGVGDDPRRRRPDISKARALLGWEPVVPLGEGLARTVAYFRNELGLAQEPPLTTAL